MGYLNEDGLETLVGKIKGQAIELTSAEYRQLPATKNTDNKLYFVTDEAYAYQIDDEPTSGSSGLVKSGGVYNWTSKIGSGTLTTTAQTIIPAVNEVNAKIGSTDISTIGDGTVTGAVDALNAELTSLDGKKIRVATHIITTDGSGAAILPNDYNFSATTGKRMLISVSIANTLKTCSNPGIASNGYPYVHVRNYDGSNCASIQVTLYCYYVQY